MSTGLLREDIDRWFDYSVHPSKRLVYIGDGEGGVDSVMHEYAVKGLRLLDQMSDAPITIHLNTEGGDWYHGMGIYDTIGSLRSHVTIVVAGYACSMGSIILQAADQRVLYAHSVVMIHDGTEALYSDTKSVEAWARKAKETRAEMYRVYLERIKVAKPQFTMKKVEALCAHDSIFTAKRAVEFGLADSIGMS